MTMAAPVHILRPADLRPVRIRLRVHVREPLARRLFIGSPRCFARRTLVPIMQKT